MNPRLLLLATLLLASPALASTPALHLLHAEDAAPSTAPILAPETAALPYSFHLAPLKLHADPASSIPLPFPSVPDEGGGAGVSSDVVPVLAILLALVVGFGTGHLIVRDRDGFILFLIVDVVIVAVVSVLTAISPFWWIGFGGLGSVALLVSHLVQVLDVYGKAFGGKLLDRARDGQILISSGAGPDPALPGTQRLLSWSF